VRRRRHAAAAHGEAAPLQLRSRILGRPAPHVRHLDLAGCDDQSDLGPGRHLDARLGRDGEHRACREVAVAGDGVPDLELPLAEQRLRLVAREADDFHWYEGHLRSAGQDELHLTAGREQDVGLGALSKDRAEGLVAELLPDVADGQASLPQRAHSLLLRQPAQGRCGDVARPVVHHCTHEKRCADAQPGQEQRESTVSQGFPAGAA
jgi:hypothetical protein